MEYKVTITEILSKEITVDAESVAEAEHKVKMFYFGGTIILDSGDFVCVEFDVERKINYD